MGGSLASKLTRQRVTWVWECEEESDASASPIILPAICADVIWKRLGPHRIGGSVARLTHQWADILRSDPRVGQLPSKATNQWVTPLRRNEEGYKIITAVSEATSISNWHFRAQANPLGEVFTPILLGCRYSKTTPSLGSVKSDWARSSPQSN
jgi:hypothetical protein